MNAASRLLLVLSACLAANAGAATLRAFATSTSGSGDLHTWPEVAGSGLTGLAAADAICQARAAAGGLETPEAFVAWLSDRDDDAYCRVFGLHGRRADHCGLAEDPVGAGPWLRSDGVPFAATIESALADNVVYSPLSVDESGDPLTAPFESFTATDLDGSFITKFDNLPDCDRWTSTNPLPLTGSSPALGSNFAAGGDWTFDGHGASCASAHHLVCLQQGSGSALSGHGRHGRREAFVTDLDVDGNLGGVGGADAICRASAATAHLYRPDTFKALIMSAADSGTIVDRFEFDGPWYRRDGLLFAHDKAELTSGAVTLPLNVTESGLYTGVAVALTGAKKDGTASGHDCADWTSQDTSPGDGALANAIAFYGNGMNWLSPAQSTCAAVLAPDDWPRKLFCLSDADVIFHDEFVTLPPLP